MPIPTPLRERLRAILVELQQAEPSGWPEVLVSVAAGSSGLDPGSLDLLADAAVQAAAIAHRLAAERDEDDGTSEDRVQRN